MNIFVLDRDPEIAARYHCDIHVVKMVTESAQLMSAAAWHYRFPHSIALMMPTHQNHPCAKWVMHSRSNFLWLRDLHRALRAEHDHRFGLIKPGGRVVHVTSGVVDRMSDRVAALIPDKGRTPFVQAMPASFRQNDPVLAYRAYYRDRKLSFAKWTKRETPTWTTTTE